MSNVESQTQYDYYKHTSLYISDYIKFADTKAGVALTVSVVIFSFFLKQFQEKIKAVPEVPEVSIVFLLIALIFIGGGIFYLGSTLWPRYTIDRNIYHSWGGISAFNDSNEYKTHLALKFQDNDIFLADMSSQNFALAGICKTKYTNLRKAFFYISIGTVLAGLNWFFT